MTLAPALLEFERQQVARARQDAFDAVGKDLPDRPLGWRRKPLTPATAAEFAKLIEVCVLHPTATRSEIQNACDDALSYGLGGVCVNSRWASFARDQVKDPDVKIVATVAFPLGAMSSKVKVRECRAASAADEYDMVADLSALRDGDLRAFYDDIAEVVQQSKGRDVKVILEMGLLAGAYEKALAACLAEAAGASYVKTSTGFAFQGRDGYGSQLGATVLDVAILAQALSDEVGIKAAGGIRCGQTARELVSNGATRIGTSLARVVVGDLPQQLCIALP